MQDSKCPMPGWSREIITTAKDFGINPWNIALIALGLLALMVWLICKPNKKPKR